MDDLREEFIAETRETLEILADQLVQWERSPDDLGLIDSAFRFVHTVKGSCGFLDLPRLLRLSHAAEEVLSFAREGRIAVCADLVTATLSVIDRIAALTGALETGESVFDNDQQLIVAMLAFLPGEMTADAMDDGPGDDVQLDEPATTVDGAGPRNKSRTVRVSLNLLDKLMNGVSDLVLARNEVSRQLRRSGASTEIDHAFGRLSTTVAEMRDAIGMMRMQHIDRLFSSLPRLLRDISIDLDKKIELTVEGSEVEVDREMVEALRDPLTHILRNSADHGIESAEERRAVGKDPVGHIHVVARQSGNQILVEISDDGRGIDVEKLGQKAIARKLLTSAQWQKMSERARLDTIFAPGLSTADAVTAISGRGVGMDVVRNNMHSIGGTIDLENHEGHGLKITLRLPLTLSIIAGLSLRAGGQIFGISRASVVEIISVTNKNVGIEYIGEMPIAKVRGKRLAYAKLETLLGVDEISCSQGMARTLVIIRPAVGATFALDVEAVVDNEELVVKPGAPLVMATGLYAGTTLPDNGRPMLLLDASGLAAAIGVEEDIFDRNTAADDSSRAVDGEQAESGLLFETFDGAVRAIRLAIVDRMEDVESSAFHEIGGRLCVSVNETLIDVRGMDSVPTESHVKLLRLSDGTSTVFLAVADVIDIFALDGAVAPSLSPEIFEGIVHVDGQPVELLSSYSCFEMKHDVVPSEASNRAVCYIDAAADDGWEQRVLAPLLRSSGYEVTFDATRSATASVVLTRGRHEEVSSDADRVVLLRDSPQLRPDQQGSIYRYDRAALLAAVGAKIAGAI